MNHLECFKSNLRAILENEINLKEIRIRNGQPFRILQGNQWKYATPNGLVGELTKSVLTASENESFEYLTKACSKSLFAFEEELLSGYFTFDNGARVGTSGKLSFQNDKPLCFSEYTSLCIRIPNEIVGISKKIYDKTGLSSILVCGKVRAGKTSFLKDLAVQMSRDANVLVVDERGELDGGNYLKNKGCDVLSRSSKNYAFSSGIRSLSPDVIVTDELSQNDYFAIKNAIFSGVKVCASIHTSDFAKTALTFKTNEVVFDYIANLSFESDFHAELFDFNTLHEII